jgi:hypothetical protein
MLKPILVLVGLASALALPCSADEPNKAESTDTQQAASSPADATDAAEREAAAAASAKEHAAVEAEVEKYFRRYGYVAVVKNGVSYYCRDEAPMGTRVKKAVCITREMAQERREEARRAMEEKFGKRSWTPDMLGGAPGG